MAAISSTLFHFLLLFSFGTMASAAIFTVQNQCSYTVWPAIISEDGPTLGDGGFTLAPGKSVHLTAEPGWSGRLWARTGCDFDVSGNGTCLTGDCGSLICAGAGETPVTIVEFTIASGTTYNDFYDVSLVDGYNVGIGVKATGGTGDCRFAGCVADLNGHCPPDLQVISSGSVVACKSACEAFKEAQFCCTDDYSTPQTCSPTQYSELFKKACPTAYSYAYDDDSSTLTCSGSDYMITFCPPT
ncbi:pathogenesis-related thaumatin-like protein 3.5 [Carya illinoinensis]|uniref:Pathogenesis-related protein 5-like n=1 Tax=Carya illinoinensis TaxID=32201 RepID=A0A8T1N3P4_CARIL|nr:pathogenesis-related thaumatin-like protein 3.5 [Carya illinoinensis]KAG6624815.1 hypothetical protein CIPAW_16G053700 [Carya illinoinensis]